MKKFWQELDKRHVGLSVCLVFSVCVIVAFYQVADNFTSIVGSIRSFVGSFLSAFMPIIFGMIIAYLLNRPCKWAEKLLMKIPFFRKKARMCRLVAVLGVNISTLSVLILFCYALVPNMILSMNSIAERGEELIAPVEKVINDIASTGFVAYLMDFAQLDIQTDFMMKILSAGRQLVSDFSSYILGFLIDVGTLLYNALFGFVAAIYINVDIDNIKRQSTRFIRVLFPKKYGSMVYVTNLANEIFFKYVVGKGICSIIVGCMSLVGCLVAGIEYASFISLIIGVTNMIPTFGPFFGAVPACLFAALSGIDKAMIMLIMIVIIQQIDPNILAPKIIGGIVDLNGFWILVSIIVCGHFFGIIGMLIGIPLFATLKILIRQWLERKEFMASVEGYLPVDE